MRANIQSWSTLATADVSQYTVSTGIDGTARRTQPDRKETNIPSGYTSAFDYNRRTGHVKVYPAHETTRIAAACR